MARAIYEAATQKDSRNPRAWLSFGIAQHAMGEWLGAIVSFEKAEAIEPMSQTSAAMASVLTAQGEYSQAIAHLEVACERDPEYVEAWNNLGSLLRQYRSVAGAIDCFDRALKLRPGHSNARYNRGLARLQLGNLPEGFSDYEARYGADRPNFDRVNLPTLPVPRWSGQSLLGKTVLVVHEQGLGDMLQFVRFAADLVKQGARVWWECPDELLALMQTCPWLERVVRREELAALRGYDVWELAMSLPLRLSKAVTDLPGPMPCVAHDPTRALRWRSRLGSWLARPGPHVALLSLGSARHSNDRHRSLSREATAQLLATPGINWLLLDQRTHDPEIAPPLGCVAVGSELRDLADTAAVLSLCDLLVSVDSAPVHVAGALGKPVWCLLAADPDWRWMLEREDSPWYPELRLWRQGILDDWTSVVESVARQLRARAFPQEAADGVVPAELDLGLAKAAGRASKLLRLSAASAITDSACLLPDHALQALQRAADALQRGHAKEAGPCFKQVLEADSEQPDALYGLARVAWGEGDFVESARLFGRAVAALSGSAVSRFKADWLRDWATALLRVGDEQAAALHYAESLLLQDDAKLAAWLAAYCKRVYGTRLAPAMAMHQKSETAAAVEVYRALMAEFEYIPDVNHLMGCALLAEEKFGEAEPLMRRAIALSPASGIFKKNLAVGLTRAGKRPEAIEVYKQLIDQNGNDTRLVFETANTLMNLGAQRVALDAYKKVVEQQPDNAQYHFMLGTAYLQTKSDEEGKACMLRAAELDPKLLTARLALGRIATDQGDFAESKRWYDEAAALAPNDPHVLWNRAFENMGIFYETAEEGEARLADFEQRMQALDRGLSKLKADSLDATMASRLPFELAYSPANNRSRLAAYGKMISHQMGRWQKAVGAPAYVKHRRKPGPIRVGVVTAFFHYHSVWMALVRGWMKACDPKEIEFHLFHTRVVNDQETARARSWAKVFHQAPKNTKQWVELITQSDCDVLLYPEIGMDPTSMKLAALRLARVQVATWGHAESSGLPTMDYYLSGELLEPDGAQAHYTEKLVLLPNLGCYVDPWPVTPEDWDYAGSGLDESRPWLICPGSPYKYQPQHDEVWAEIARQNPDAQLVFFQHERRQGVCDRIQARIQRAFVELGPQPERHLVYVPWLSPPKFFGMMKRSAVFLDTIGFSGFNTALQAMECGLPIVTMEGRFMRGRLAYALLQCTGMAERHVVQDADAYVARTGELLKAGKRADYGVGAVYRDASVQAGFVEFVRRAVQ